MSKKRFKLVPEMEGRMARWYARQRATESQLAAVRKQATKLTHGLSNGARVLEIAMRAPFNALSDCKLQADLLY